MLLHADLIIYFIHLFSMIIFHIINDHLTSFNIIYHYLILFNRHFSYSHIKCFFFLNSLFIINYARYDKNCKKKDNGKKFIRKNIIWKDIDISPVKERKEEKSWKHW